MERMLQGPCSRLRHTQRPLSVVAILIVLILGERAAQSHQLHGIREYNNNMQRI